MKHPPHLGIQLYGLYESTTSLPDLIQHVGAAGFDGVEFAHRFHDANPRVIADALDDTSVNPIAVHANLPTLEAAVQGQNDLLDKNRTIGISRVVIPHLPMRHFSTHRTVAALIGRLTLLARELRICGTTLVLHSSRYEFWPILPTPIANAFESTPIPNGTTTYLKRSLVRARRPTRIPRSTGFWSIVAETSPSELQFEIDVAEVTAGGINPLHAMQFVSDRLPLIHVRDIARTGLLGSYHDVPHGKGIVDIERAIEVAIQTGVDWIVYEDEIPRDLNAKLKAGTSFLGLLKDHTEPGSPAKRQIGT